MRHDGNILACFGFFLRTRGAWHAPASCAINAKARIWLTLAPPEAHFPQAHFLSPASSFRRLYLLTDPLAGLIGWTMGSGPWRRPAREPPAPPTQRP
jgi:hypothetical protein